MLLPLEKGIYKVASRWPAGVFLLKFVGKENRPGWGTSLSSGEVFTIVSEELLGEAYGEITSMYSDIGGSGYPCLTMTLLREDGMIWFLVLYEYTWSRWSQCFEKIA